ncbi:MAG: hypothetical protein NWR09_01255 [Pseudomonadales bacterium]|nr:hypothetical protein [Pseudomonadales bacterium]MDP5059401.1 hypothetical protein [Pseudomonadales bacterium]
MVIHRQQHPGTTGIFSTITQLNSVHKKLANKLSAGVDHDQFSSTGSSGLQCNLPEENSQHSP